MLSLLLLGRWPRIGQIQSSGRTERPYTAGAPSHTDLVCASWLSVVCVRAHQPGDKAGFTYLDTKKCWAPDDQRPTTDCQRRPGTWSTTVTSPYRLGDAVMRFFWVADAKPRGRPLAKGNDATMGTEARAPAGPVPWRLGPQGMGALHALAFAYRPELPYGGTGEPNAERRRQSWAAICARCRTCYRPERADHFRHSPTASPSRTTLRPRTRSEADWPGDVRRPQPGHG